MKPSFHRKLFKHEFDKETIGLTVVSIIAIYILWRISGRLFKRKEDYEKQKTIIKYLPNDGGIAAIKDVSGLGLSIIHFVIDDYLGFCCTSCGPIFHVTLVEMDDDLVCKCCLCSMELCSEEKKQIKLFIEELHSKRKLGNSQVMCSNTSHGCNVVLPLKKLKEHIQHCPYTKVLCPRSCGAIVERQYMKHHIKLCMHRNHTNQELGPPYPTVTEAFSQPPIPSSPPPPYEMKL